jgi:hypothetical protein
VPRHFGEEKIAVPACLEPAASLCAEPETGPVDPACRLTDKHRHEYNQNIDRPLDMQTEANKKSCNITRLY